MDSRPFTTYSVVPIVWKIELVGKLGVSLSSQDRLSRILHKRQSIHVNQHTTAEKSVNQDD
jgi:hypothetical protein